MAPSTKRPAVDSTPPILTIAVSSRALFNFELEHKIFEQQGPDSYMRHQRQNLETPATTGVAFSLVKKLLGMNRANEKSVVEVVVISRNDPTTGLRVFYSMQHHQLVINRGCFTRGTPAYPYLHSFGAHLFISADAADVRNALKSGVPAAHVHPKTKPVEDDETLRIAFDADAVIFSDESERVYQKEGLKKFEEREARLRDKPLSPGPIKPFFEALHRLKQHVGTGKIRTALISSRGVVAGERVINTFRQWEVEIDETYFLSGMEKQEIIKTFDPDFYFDDQPVHLKGVDTGGHVDAGVINE